MSPMGTSRSMASPRPDYGIDAPGVIRTMAIIGGVAIVLSITRFDLHMGTAIIDHHTWYGFAVSFTLTAVLMLLYSKIGKFSHRDRMLQRINWRGDEHVLDVGTGRGLLLVGAAKRLTTGRAVGVDIWSTKDLSGNSRERTEQNLGLEGVDDKCELRNDPAQQLNFPDNSFDVVLSNLCLHNIPKARERDQACAEIVRVLKPGGRAVISDFIHARRYADQFRKHRMSLEMHWSWGTFPPLRIIDATKAHTQETGRVSRPV